MKTRELLSKQNRLTSTSCAEIPRQCAILGYLGGEGPWIEASWLPHSRCSPLCYTLVILGGCLL